jgi:hypothetical protein
MNLIIQFRLYRFFRQAGLPMAYAFKRSFNQANR